MSEGKKVIHFGSLEETFAKDVLAESKAMAVDDTHEEPKEIDESQSKMPLTDSQMELLREIEMRRKARQITIPTDDKEIKLHLRRLGEPICLFGEGPAERRERLRDLVARKGYDQSKKDEATRRDLAAALASKSGYDTSGLSSEAANILGRLDGEVTSKKTEQDVSNVTWYHEGSQALLEARMWLASHSVENARNRLRKEKEWLALPAAQRQARRHDLRTKLTNLESIASQVGDSRPVASVNFSPSEEGRSSQMLATAGWSGSVKLWSVPDCFPLLTWQGHSTPATCVAFHPNATEPPSKSEEELLDSPAGGVVATASCAHDGSVRLWSVDSPKPLADLEGHAPHRVSRVNFHPSGRFLATCCYDSSWRLWDLEVGEELLHQEGHTRAVYDIAFHPDGGLAASASLDCFARLWDLRTGKCVLFMDGHQRPVLGIDFSKDGLNIATASQDNTLRLWDIRQRCCVYTLPAHTGAISQVRFGSGAVENTSASVGFLATASYDGTIRLWDSPSCAPLRTLAGHESRVTSVAIAPDAQLIASASFDRTFKLWAPSSTV